MITHNATTINLANIIENNARMLPEREAFVQDENRITFAKLNAMACQVANGLKEMGIGCDDKVAISCPNLIYFPIVFFGILKTGAVAVPLNILFRSREIAYHLKDSDAKAIFVFEGISEFPLANTVKAGFDEVKGCRDLIVMTLNPMSPTPIDGAKTLTQLITGQPETFENYPTKPDDTAVIIYTSGTTGQPKGAELTHLNTLMNSTTSVLMGLPALQANDIIGETGNRQLITVPLFHSTGLISQMCSTTLAAGTNVLLPRFEPQIVLETLRKEKVNYWTGVPTMHWALLKYIEETDFDMTEIRENFRFVSSGGAPMPVELQNKLKITFGENVKITEGYGLSETSPVATFNHFTLPHKPGTVGQALFACEVKVVDDEDKEVPSGTRGEIVIRGHNVMKGYYKRPEATAEAMRNGWFHTGDIGVMDADNYLSIVDRKKDMILRGGYNVYPRELEEVIMTHEAVSLVAVIGIADEKLGEEVKACIILKPDAKITTDEMREWCKEQFAANKYPRIVEICETLPLGATGKILKRELREMQSATAKI